jgi:hypothetical protein
MESKIFNTQEMEIMIKRFYIRRKSLNLLQNEIKTKQNLLIENKNSLMLSYKNGKQKDYLLKIEKLEYRSQKLNNDIIHLENLVDLFSIDIDLFFKIITINSVFEKTKY